MNLPFAEPYKIKMVETLKRSNKGGQGKMDKRSKIQPIQP